MKFTVRFEKFGETKGTWRYQEVVPDEDAPVRVGTLYVKKSAVIELGRPENLTVTIEPS